MRVFIYLLPVLIPFFIYYISYSIACTKAQKEGKPEPKFYDPSFVKIFLISLSIGVLCFMVLISVVLKDTKSGQYIPARAIDGKIEEGYVIDENAESMREIK